MNEVLIAGSAEDDYSDSLNWYAERSSEAARRFEEEFLDAIEAISANPYRYPWIDDRHRFCLLRHFPFQVIYRELPSSQLLIVAVAHTSRRPGYWRDR